MTEREIEAVLRAVPTVCGNLRHPSECGETGCVETGDPDYPAMARAVVERVVEPLQERVTALQGNGSGHLHRCARVNGRWVCDKACRVAECDARLARLANALQTISDLKDEAYESEPVSREAADVVARHAGRIAKAALADAGAGEDLTKGE